MKASLLVAALLCAAPAGAVTFTKIADATSHPLGFVEFGTPSLDAGVVAFHGLADSGGAVSGIYTGTGGALTTVVDSDAPLGLSSLRRATISQGNVAFIANEVGDPAVWASIDGTLTRIAGSDTSDPVSGTSLVIDSSRTPMIDGGNVAFGASYGGASDFGEGIFTSVDGALERTASYETTLSGGGEVIGYGGGQFDLDGTSVAFSGGNATILGFFVAETDVARVVVDGTQTLPGYEGIFAGDPMQIAMDGGNVAFLGNTTLASDPLVTVFGVYAEIGGVLFRVADSQMLIPGESKNFLGFFDPAISGNTIAFTGGQDELFGLYSYRDGELIEVLAVGDTLDGKIVSHIDFGTRGLSGDQLAFTATFQDGSYGVYLAAIPEPGTGLLLALGFAALARRRRSG